MELNAYIQLSRQARNDSALGHFQLVEKVRMFPLTKLELV